MPKCNCCGASKRAELFQSHIYTLGRCTACNLHYVDPMPDGDERLADVKAGQYGDGQKVMDAKQQLAAEHMMEPRLRQYIDLARRWSPTGRFLDVGCGAGFLMTLAQRAGYVTEGIELTADRHAMASYTTGSVIHDQAVEDIALDSGAYDVITLINVFSHLADPGRTLAELGRILRPGGALIVATGEIAGRVKKAHLPEWTLGDELFFLGVGTLDRYAGARGMEVVESHKVWLPDSIYTRDRFEVKGRSHLRNAMKLGFVTVPGALPALRYAMKRRQADNPIYSAVYVLKHSEMLEK